MNDVRGEPEGVRPKDEERYDDKEDADSIDLLEEAMTGGVMDRSAEAC